MTRISESNSAIKIPSPHDWRTTDSDEINKRRLRAQSESFTISNLDPKHPIFSNFCVKSGSGMTYSVEVRDLRQRHFACDCVDFRINGLGTCKHVEAVLLHLAARYRRLFQAAEQNGGTRIEIVPDPNAGTLRVANRLESLPRALDHWFDGNGLLKNVSPEDAVETVERLRSADFPALRISQEVQPWLAERGRVAERKELRHEYELKVQKRRMAGARNHSAALSRISARACCTWPSPSARCWPMKWAWARPSRPSPRARCCTGSARRGACWSSRRPRSRPSGRSRFSGSPICRISSSSAAAQRPNGCECATTANADTVLHHRQLRADARRRAGGERAASARTSSCSTKRSASRTGAPRPPRPSSGCAAATPSCSPARPSRTALTSCIR